MLRQHQPLPYPFEPHGLELPPAYAELREQPLARIRMPYGDGAWLVTRYEDVRAVLADPRFSLAAAMGEDQPRMRPVARTGAGLFSTEPPEHTRLRSLVAREFSARRVERLRTRAVELADELLDGIIAAGRPADLVEDFAIPMPTTIICEVLGIPAKDHRMLWHWAETVLSAVTPGEVFATEGQAFMDYMAGMLELRGREPGDDLLTTLVRACREQGLISEEELLSIACDLLIAGFISTTNQIGNFFHQLLVNPEELVRLRERPELIPGAVEELMRYVPLLTGFSLPRYATADVELGGVTIRAGEAVMIATAAANRDPEVFQEPERLVLDRPANPHIGFGHGVHYCVGAHLARLELQVAIERVPARLPGLRLAVPEHELRWKEDAMVNGLQALPVAW
ncbi:cytochrome P450 [Streptomyces ipomoeae]|jgi:cytochrome P450|uniref:Unspecific monooxygenase n=2 Tax=Streptomyces ipomoeae TaxID=103232 RepID=L1L0U6_9ACTN|nr:cytochrome P450 [Streptomyces ipomoeae]EKX66295.1 unspecific monooxygenase [Streptomyces ipomoeae 91-03]MDX2697450.1 cytochrome P450 [Streptomyces ipomoeae]MDX2824547.1 cytochrome P450 [Streptomyces ipomoeae]MDX2842249.1 cytochrome P450 [Streptomyces ipomoeae]MDX2877535.1 cytochrome P450 [Streptomyces ipomoeae]